MLLSGPQINAHGASRTRIQLGGTLFPIETKVEEDSAGDDFEPE